MSTPEENPSPASAASAAPSAPEPLTVTAADALAAQQAVDAKTAGPRAGLEASLERVATLLIRQQQAERRWRVFFRLAWLGLALVVLWLATIGRMPPSAPSTPHTALVEVRGEIAAEGEASAEVLLGALKNAFEDAGAQAVVLRINSPGGSPVQSGIIHDEIKRLKAKHNKKVYAVVEEICASGAFYIAVAADERH